MNGMLIIVWLYAAAAVAVFAAMIASTIRFHTSLLDCPRTSVSSKAIELLWALIPIVIVLASATPALRSVGFVNANRQSSDLAVAGSVVPARYNAPN
jgi:heme/copper-type cytochrome/quinol oxidase subunit 2